jgi:hypothetical protein
MPSDLTDVDAFTSPVTVPEPGDDRKASSVEGAFQALADRTFNLKNRLDGSDAADHVFTGSVEFNSDDLEPLYCSQGVVINDASSEYNYGSNRVRTVLVPLHMGVPDYGSSSEISLTDGTGGTGGRLFSNSASPAVVMFPLPIPSTATLLNVRAGVRFGGGGGGTVDLRVFKHVADLAGGWPTVTEIGAGDTGTGTSTGDILSVGMSETADRAARYYTAECTITGIGSAVVFVEAQYTEGGVRTF